MNDVIEVQILGQSFTITSDEGEEHVRQVAAMLDERLRAAAGGKESPSFATAVVTALNIASEYHTLKQRQERVEQMIRRLRARLEEIEERES